MKRLLPPNATEIERNLADICADAVDLPVERLREINDPYKCSVERLPSLAAERSVDRWDENWSEQAKRKVIANSPFVHKHKGTIGAVRRVVEPLGYLLRVREWWEETPEGVPGTFKLDIGVTDSGITEATYHELERLIDDAKPLTRHVIGLSISIATQGRINTAAACYSGEIMTVYPYLPEDIIVASHGYTGAAVHVIESMEVFNG
ncbi:phage tail protein I [Plesiomonas shigelloides]|uniref:phage tail protein I n=1 Tax=Plesiomonas shigelloides TaxID=703 RepID=UPI00126259CD|nr:phage tail protein I [Plesiomonas shigelloides]KAB7672830.1 phage tail protein I [Plesiomonas shigelloides]